MPILDPSIQYFLLADKNKGKINATYSDFFNRYLKIASQNLNHDYLTVDALIQFKKDLQSNINLINNKFGYNIISEKDFANQNNIKNDYYSFLSEQIRKTKSKASKHSFGTYFVCKENFSNLRINTDIKKSSNIPNGIYTTKFYQIKLSTYHSWYFSDTPVAILCLDTNIPSTEKEEESNKQEILHLIKLEIDLMVASGFTLVLCYNGTTISKDFLFQIIKDDQFSELHLNIYEDEKLLTDFLTYMKDDFFIKNIFIKGFIYLYSCFFEDYTFGWMLLQIFKLYPRTKTILFSLPLAEALKKPKFKPSKPFPYCKTGFKCKYLRVYLIYVPISDQIRKNRPMKTEVSGLSIGYVFVENFLYRKRGQTPILFFDINDRNLSKMIYFDNIHSIKPDLFVNSTLSLTQMQQETHESINKIEENLIDDYQPEQSKKRKSIQKTISAGDLYDSIIYVANEYTQFMKKTNKNFHIRPTQIYAVIEACNMFFQNPNEAMKKSKGVVYQIKTGEGKSCIITLIAAVLALKGKSAHIVSSNIKLSTRDYAESFDFFQNLALKSSVLLHKNELPQNSEDEKDKKIVLKDPNGYFNDDVFQNTSRMNYCACGIDNNNVIKKGADVIFSTLVNLECFYLYLMENQPRYIKEYYQQCGLLIDEADSILIDEITNGTILSREIKSNARQILSYVYNSMQNVNNNNTDKLDDLIKTIKKLPMTNHISRYDVRQMMDEANLVKSNVFSDGKKYSIEPFEVKNKKIIQKLYKKTCKTINDFSDLIKNSTSNFFVRKDDDFNEDEEEEDMNNVEEDDDEEEDLDIHKTKKFRKIIPFDYDHKGILEENKEFSGFIPQFIALKESENYDDLIFKEISINYLYVSHPIYAGLYPNICGFTGTIGQLIDKETFSNHYKLATKKVPRFRPNLRVDFPLIACNNINERNIRIVNEVLQFHDKRNPVLVIFQDFNEIDEVKRMIFSKLCKDNPNLPHKIIVFDGKSKDTEPGFNAGIEGAISLGTNICGRGTNIQCSSSFPLHVIVAYYSKNSRVMKQAFGRTARNGQAGTCRCICLKKQLVTKRRDEDKVDDIVDELFVKSEVLNEFIEKFKRDRSWIFDFIDKKQNFLVEELRKNKELKKLRKAKINVNRIVAYKFRWPICMTYETFLDIQAQRIFSIFNCPNSKYTWRLFQRYVREMILQSWSLMVDKFDQERKIGPEKIKPSDRWGNNRINRPASTVSRIVIPNKNTQTKPKEKTILSKYFNENYINNKENEKRKLHNSYKESLIMKKNELIKVLERYLPKDSHIDIVSTFINICNQVIKDHQENVLKSLKGKAKAFVTFGSYKNTFFQLGFKPYALRNLSGARITFDNISETNYIEDPELKYERKMPNGTFQKASITERIDFIFNKIFQKISSVLGEKSCLQFFMRRTLAGCEFGICLDLLLNDSDDIDSDKIIIVDKNPLLMLTIYTWSMAPLLGGILLIVLVYVARLAKQIAERIVSPTTAITKDVILKAANSVIMKVSEIFLSKVIEFLTDVLSKQIEKLEGYVKNDKEKDENIFLTVIKALKNIFFDHEGYDKLSGMLEDRVKIPSISKSVFGECFNYQTLIKIGLLLILCLATFLTNFQYRKQLKLQKKNAKEYDSIYDKNKYSSSSNKVEVVNDDDIENNPKFKKAIENAEKDSKEDSEFEINPLLDKENQEIENMYNNVMKNIINELMNSAVNEKEVKLTDIKLIEYPRPNYMYNTPLDLSFVYVSDESFLWRYYSQGEYRNYSYQSARFAKKEDKFEDEFVTNTFTCIRKSTNQKCVRYFRAITNEFCNCISLFINNQHPSILPFVGYVLNLNHSFLLFEIVKNKYSYITLKDSLEKDHDYSKDYNNNGLILAYGIACGMEYLEKNGIYYNSIYSRNVLLDDDLHPYIFPFEPDFNSYKACSDFDYNPPEFRKPEEYSLPKAAVYSFGVLLYEISNRSFDLFDEFLNGVDTFENSYKKEWIDLMRLCLDEEPNERPSFTDICDKIESFKYKPKGLRNYIEQLKPKRLFDSFV